MTNTELNWLLVNARSGSNTPEAIAELHDTCDDGGVPVARQIDFPDEKVPTPANLREAGVTRLLVFTGDGTLSTVMSALAGWDGQVLVLPGGTMNLVSRRMHGDRATLAEIVSRVARGACRAVRPQLIRTEAGDALADVVAGPGAAWAEVREAMRDRDVASFAQSASEALGRTTGGSRVRLASPRIGREEGYPLIEIQPGHRGIQVDGYGAADALDVIKQGWALLRHSFRDGPHERLALCDEILLENCAGEPIDILLDGEPAQLPASARLQVASCEVDLLATEHGF